MNYTKTNNKYLAIPKDNPKDRIQVEIGDTKQSDFKPQVKIMRWDNEINFSARLKHNEVSPTVSKDGEKIKWQGTKIEAHLYALTDGEGGHEFEVILKEKPTSNKIEFTIQTKGLEFFYQPELTDEEKLKGVNRPENVVGSYAVYYKDTPKNYVGGKEYKAGKALHIYRPKIIDANGWEVWGGLNIDEKQGLMTVTIPQDFLDKAVYPVKHAAGATFGYTTIGATTYSIYNLDDFCGALFTSPSDISAISKYSIYFSVSSQYSDMVWKVKGATWLHSDLSLVSSSVGTEIISSGGNITVGWNDSTATPTFSASTDYVLGVLVYRDNAGHGGAGGAMTMYFDTGSANQAHYGNKTGIYATPSSISGYVSSNTDKFSIYATYTPSGGITTPKTILGKARITVATLKTIAGKGRITATTLKTILGKANIITDKDYTKGNPASLPANNTDLTAFSTTEINNVAVDDANYAIQQTNSPNFSIQMFKNKNANNTDQIAVNWKGKTDRAPSISTVYLQIWNNNSSAWETLASNNSAAAGSDFTLSGSVTTNLAYYYATSNWISCRVYQEVK